MRKNINQIVFIILLIMPCIIMSQPLGDEWINYNQKYYRIPIVENGIYRITHGTLVAAGVPVNTFDPRQIQIFCKGQEQHIFVKGENDGIFGTDDYIEFYGEKNTAWLDEQMYRNPSHLVNSNYSLINDTSAYFLTWTASINNKRIIIENDNDFSAYNTSPYIWRVSRQNYTTAYFGGRLNSASVPDFEYVDGKGFFDWEFKINPYTPGVSVSITKNIPTKQIYTPGPPAKIDFKIIGASNSALLIPDHHLTIQFAGQFIDTLYEGYTTIHIQRDVPANQLGSNNTTFIFTLPNDLPGNGADRNTIAYIQIEYPHNHNMEGLSDMHFIVPDAAQSKAKLQLTNINITSGDSVIIYDIDNHKRIKAVQVGSLYNVLIPNSGGDKNCIMTTGAEIKTIQNISPVNHNTIHSGSFINFSNYTNVDYIIITHTSLLTSATQYANYRNITGYNSLVVDVETLYDQFSYGIRKHPLAIRNFLKYGLINFADIIHGVFLIGKALYPQMYRQNATNYAKTLVPSMGDPPSDVMFTSRIIDTLYAPAIPTGRLSAKNTDHVDFYFNKVIDFEAAQNAPNNPTNPTEKEWMKNVLHFAGGSNIAQGQMLENYLNVYKDSLENPYYGANVMTFRKNTTDPIQPIISDSILDLINNGISLMNFFGHYGGIGFDIGVDYPQYYNNFKKYFFLTANSCYSGDLYQDGETSAEVFVLIENKGAIGYLASISASLASDLYLYTKEFMGAISYSNYNKSVGSSIQKTIRRIQIPNSINVKDISYSMALHADPVLKLNTHEKPDYLITPQRVYFTPQNVTTELDSFVVNVISTNAGKAIIDTFIVQLTRHFPDNSEETYHKLIPATIFKDTIPFKLPVDNVKGVGMNSFYVMLDAYHGIEESNEDNNSTTVNLFIISSDIIPIYPPEFAVIPTPTIKLIASTGYPFLPTSDFIFEIDTTDEFTNVLGSTVINQSGGIIEWNVPFSLSGFPDSTVFYWRTKMATTDNWRESSFQYIPGKKGWGQSHFFQYKKNDFKYINCNRQQRIFEFDTATVLLSVQCGYFPYIGVYETWWKINMVMKGGWSCTDYNGDGMKFVVFDSVTAEPWVSPWQGPPAHIGIYGNIHCKAYDNSDLDYFTVASTDVWHPRMVNLINMVPNGNYVLAYSHRNHNAQHYSEQLYQAFKDIGSNYIEDIQNHRPYIIFGRKGYYGQAEESIGSDMYSIIQRNFTIPININKGYIESTTIGPASNWGSLHWRIEPCNEESPENDNVALYVLGIRFNGDIDTIINALDYTTINKDIYDLEAFVDVSIYPYLKLHLKTQDDSTRTPTQLQRWHVLYEGMPETAISPNLHFTFYNDTVQEGEYIRMSVATKNISEYDFPDSLLVSYWVIDKTRDVHPIAMKRTIVHPSQHVLVDSISFSTVGLAGLNSLWVEFNPINPSTGIYDQLEQYHFNNIGEIPFYVGKDRINPILDVTFDGIRILDGDIVSSKPLIQIMVKDENKFLFLDDTTAFRVLLQKPGSAEIERVYFTQNGQEKMRFYPATSSSNNTCRIEYPAEFPIDGDYKLMVQARDKSKNESGDMDYIINFEVVNKSTITEVMNWPNPFSTRTHFVFTLTGSQIPDYFKIQIMTITGKVVREIDISELGPLNIGRNITHYAWDGRDQFGDQLANGIYLYRVITRISGQDIEKIENKASEFFTKQFGKMVLIR